MKFNFINLAGFLIVMLMMVPNVIFAPHFKNAKNNCTSPAINAAEQIGRYSSFLLMFMPLLVWEFSFATPGAAAIYFISNALLLAAYFVCFVYYIKKNSRAAAIAAAVLPIAIFLISGLALRHYLLVAAAVLFGAAHITITYINTKPGEE